MNIVFVSLLILSSMILLVTSPDSVYTAMIDGASSGITISVHLFAIYAICIAILDIMEKIGANRMIDKAMLPLTRRLFPHEDRKTLSLISMNFSANLLGIGSVATPLGIDATRRMNEGRTKASHNSILFAVINATSISLLPTTIIGIRSSSGSKMPSSIVLPVLISTGVATLVGVALCYLLRGKHD